MYIYYYKKFIILNLIFLILKIFSKTLDKNSILIYKDFLNTKGSELSKTTEFLAYYALPYIKDPLNHPALKHLFTKGI